MLSTFITMAEMEFELPDTPPEQHVTFRSEITTAFSSVSSVIKAIVRPLPTDTGDGSYITTQKTTGLLHDLTHVQTDDLRTLVDVAEVAVDGEPVKDKTYLMERVVKLASELPSNSRDGLKLNDAFIQLLYTDLQHPPAVLLGNEQRYRTADGSFNVCCSCSS